jgi:hypothetical protein
MMLAPVLILVILPVLIELFRAACRSVRRVTVE